MNKTKDPLSKMIVQAVRSVIGTDPAGLHDPQFDGNEWKYVKDCIDTGWVSSVGSYVDRFEAMLEDYTGVAKAVATVNGTAALQISLLLAGVKPNDEVLVPDFTFVATANAVSYCGAIPHFVDISFDTLGLDPIALDNYLHKATFKRGSNLINKSTGRVIRAIMPMHCLGHPFALDELLEVCHYYGLCMVEDAAESLGSRYKGVHTGRFGKLAALSFNGNKIITTGGGGAILTDDVVLGKLAKHLTTTARTSDNFNISHDQIGFNYRMPNLNAALGCAQLENITQNIKQKRQLADRYASVFSAFDMVKIVQEPAGSFSNYWLISILLDPEYAYQRDEILQSLNDVGIAARPAWKLMHGLPMHIHSPRAPLPVSEDIERRLISLPSSAGLV